MVSSELLIEISAGEWTRLDLGDDLPAVVFQLNDFNELKDRQASYSQALALPITDRNCKALGFANVFDARSDAPYRSRRCVWYVDGAQVIGPSFRLDLISVSTTFNCQIVSAVAEVFGQLGKRQMADADLPPIVWSAERIAADMSAADPASPHVWLFANTTQRAAGDYATLFPVRRRTGDFTGMADYFVAADIMPYYRLLPLVKRIIEAAGYELDTDVETVAGYEEHFISLADLKPGADSMSTLERSASGPSFTPVEGGLPVYMLSGVSGSTFIYGELNALANVPDPDDAESPTAGFEYCSPGAANVVIGLLTTATASAITDSVYYRISRLGASIATWAAGLGQDGFHKEVVEESDDAEIGETWYSEEIAMSPGDRLYIEAILQDGSTSSAYQCTMSVDIPDASNAVPAGGVIYPAKSIDLKTELDVVKLFVQLYGLLVDVEVTGRTIKMHSLDRTLRRALEGDYVDWSNKLDARSGARTTSFRLGSYAQENRIVLPPNAVTGAEQFGVIRVDDETLAATRDAITLSGESTSAADFRVVPGANGVSTLQTADIDPRYEASSDGLYRFEDLGDDVVRVDILPVAYRASRTHIVRRVQAYDPGSTSDTYATVFMLPRGAVPDAAAAANKVLWSDCYVAEGIDLARTVRVHYGALEHVVLNPARVVKANFWLRASDIMTLDMLRPVYLDAYGSFFYVQKIDNYVPGELTEVTLVAMEVEDAPAPPPVESGAVTFTGAVTDAATGAGLSNAVVEIYGEVGEARRVIGRVRTREDGTYEMTINMRRAQWEAAAKFVAVITMAGFAGASCEKDNTVSFDDALAAPFVFDSVGLIARSGTVQFTGRAVDADTGAPITGAHVMIGAAMDPNVDGEAIGQGYTDSAGNFSIGVGFTQTGYESYVRFSAYVEVSVGYDGVAMLSAGLPGWDAAAVTGVPFGDIPAAMRNGTIYFRGNVVGEPGAHVIVGASFDPNESVDAQAIGQGYADATGAYNIGVACSRGSAGDIIDPNGSRIARVVAWSDQVPNVGVHTTAIPTFVEAVASGITLPDIVAQTGTVRFTGRCLFSDGSPAAGVSMEVRRYAANDVPGTLIGASTTDAAGYFAIDYVADAGTWSTIVRFGASGGVLVGNATYLFDSGFVSNDWPMTEAVVSGVHFGEIRSASTPPAVLPDPPFATVYFTGRAIAPGTGAAIAGAHVIIGAGPDPDTDSSAIAQGYTDAAGNFSLGVTFTRAAYKKQKRFDAAVEASGGIFGAVTLTGTIPTWQQAAANGVAFGGITVY